VNSSSAPSIQTWFNAKINRKILILMLVTLGFQLLLSGMLGRKWHQQREEEILDDALTLGMQYDRRDQTAMNAHAELLRSHYRATFLAICDHTGTLRVAFYDLGDHCREPLSLTTLRIRAPLHQSTRQLELVLDYPALDYLVMLGPYSLVLLCFFACMLLVLHGFHHHLGKELVGPIQRLLQPEEPLPRIKELAELQTNFRHLTRSLQEQSALAAIGKTSAMLAHDLRKPFAAMRTFFSLLPAQGSDPDFLLRWQTAIEQGGKRIESMLSEVLQFASTGNLQQKPCNLQDLLSAAATEVFTTHPSLVTLTYDLALRLTPYVDETKILRLLINLLANAVEAMHGMGTIHIASEALLDTPGRWMRLSLTNSNSLIPPEVQEHLFEAYYTHGKPGGTGLGLAICKKVVEDHGGRIWVESTVATGTCFSFTLPCSDLSEPGPTLPLHPRGSDFATGVRPGPHVPQPKVVPAEATPRATATSALLIVDDDPLLREGTKLLLARHVCPTSGHAILTAAGPEEALEMLADHPVEVVITDLHLSESAETEGLELIRQLKNLRPDLAVFALSCSSASVMETSALAAGATAYFEAPLTSAMLERIGRTWRCT